MKTYITLLLLGFLCLGCNSRPATKPITTIKTPPETPVVVPPTEPVSESETQPTLEEDFTAIQFNVAVGISAQRPRWVLFKNGTYIIFPEGYTDQQIKDKAIEMVSNYSGSDVNVTKSSLAKGWIATTSNGIYNYIDPNDLGQGIPENSTISAQAQQNIQADKQELRVIHINKKN